MTARRSRSSPDEVALRLAHQLVLTHLLVHASYPVRCQLALDLARLAGRSRQVRSLAARLLMESSLRERTAEHHSWLAQVEDWCERHPVGADGRYGDRES